MTVTFSRSTPAFVGFLRILIAHWVLTQKKIHETWEIHTNNLYLDVQWTFLKSIQQLILSRFVEAKPLRKERTIDHIFIITSLNFSIKYQNALIRHVKINNTLFEWNTNYSKTSWTVVTHSVEISEKAGVGPECFETCACIRQNYCKMDQNLRSAT